MNFIIRHAKKEDLNTINKFAVELHNFHKNSRPDIFKESARVFTDDKLEEISNGGGVIFVAESEDKNIAGFFYIEYRTPSETDLFKESKIAYFSLIYIDKNYRRLNLASKLLDAGIEDLKSRKIDRVEYRTWSFNSPITSFLDSKFKVNNLYTVSELILN